MVKSCAAMHCSNRQGREKRSGKCESISFHSFPLHDPDRLQQWIAALHRDVKWMPNQYSTVCSEHFKLSDFIYCPNGKQRRLKPEAIPSFFNFTKNIQRRELERQIKESPLITGTTTSIYKSPTDAMCLKEEEVGRAIKKQKLSNSFSKITDGESGRKRSRVWELANEVHDTKAKKIKQEDYSIKSIQNVIEETRKRNLISVEYADFVKFLIKP